MAKYTPGPWRIERGKVVDRSGNVVARVPVENRSLAEVREGSGNTHLIAAAPELLWFVEQIDKYADSLLCRDFDPTMPQFIASARDVLARVEGRESSNQLEK